MLGASIGLGVDESYAVSVARPASLSYYDHPPLVFWITALVERIAGAQSDLVLRLPFILLFAATTWVIARLTWRIFGARAAAIAAVLLQVIPVFGVSDGGWILPDGPLLFAFAATALCLSHAVAGEMHGTRWWLGVGASIGVALLAKYHAVLLVAGVVAFLMTTQRGRQWLRRPQPYAAAIVAMLMATPVLVWNAQHDWASIRFQMGRGDVAHGIHAAALLQNLAGQAGYILPWIWLLLVWQFVQAIRRGPRDEARWMLACLAAGPVVLFTVLSLGGRAGLPHWPAPGYFLLVPLLADSLVRWEARGHTRAVRLYLYGTAVVVAALLAFAVSQIRTGWFSRAYPGLFTRGDPSLDAVDWRELRPAIAALSTDSLPLVAATNWIDAAKIGAALAPTAVIVCLNDDDRHFHFIADRRALAGRTALLVERAREDSANAAANVTIHRGGRAALHLSVRHVVIAAR